jgi:hypothetical protein
MPNNDSFGRVQDPRAYKFGQCRFCWDENWAREHHFFFGDGRPAMIGPVCKHRLKAPKHIHPQFKANRLREIRRALSAGRRRFAWEE